MTARADTVAGSVYSRWTAGTALDASNPWPGLESFRERDTLFFRGRSAEADSLLRLVRRSRSTVLFGVSGLGKSSLFQAGIFPRLREERLLPVYVRLAHDDDAAPLSDQLLTELSRAAAAEGVEAPPIAAGTTLWEHFHKRDAGYWTPDNLPVIPVLVLDQFEEVFTVGRESPARAARTAAFLEQLADLIEGRVPTSVKARVDSGEIDVGAFAVSRHDYKILIGIRADFLAALETLRAAMPLLGSNRMELAPLRGDAALAVTEAGGALVPADVGERIVRLVAASPANNPPPLAQLVVDPALLSLFCRELNERRKLAGAPAIGLELVEGSREAILREFYDRSVADLGDAVRQFVEERLITVDGYRNSEALQNALATPGVTRQAIDLLIARRLIRVEESDGRPPRVELTHDVLAGLVRSSRDARHDQETVARANAESARAAAALREAKRQVRATRFVAATVAAVAILAAVAAGVAWKARAAAHRALAASELRMSSDEAADGHGSEALALAADAVALDPDNGSARTAALWLMGARAWPIMRLGSGGIWSSAFSPDGQTIVTGSYDNTARLWAASTGRPVGQPFVHSYRVRSVAYSPDSRRLATTANDSLFLWDIATHRQVVAPVYAPGARLARFSGDGRRIVGLGTDIQDADTLSDIWIWNASTPASATPLIKAKGYLNDVALSPDGTLIATAGDDGFVRVWDASSGWERQHFQFGTRWAQSVAFSPDGTRLLAAAGRAAHLIELSTGHEIRTFRDTLATVWYVAFNRDAKFVVTGSSDSTVRVWDVESAKPVTRPMRQDGEPEGVSISPDGTRTLVTVQHQSAALWDNSRATSDAVEGVPRVFHLANGSGVRAIAMSRDGSLVALSSDDTTAEIWPTKLLLESRDFRVGQTNVWDATFSPDDRRVLTSAADGSARTWDARSGRPVGGWMGHRDVVYRSQFSPDGKHVATASLDSTVQLWDAETGTRIGVPLVHTGWVVGLAFTPDGKELVTAATDRLIRRWDVATGTPVATPIRLGAAATSLHLSPNGKQIVTAASDSLIQIWDRQTGQQVGMSIRMRAQITDAVFIPDGSGVLAAASDSCASFWNPATGTQTREPLRHAAWVNTARFSDDGTRIVTSSDDSTVRLWDAKSGAPIGPPLRHSDRVNSAVFSHHGDVVLSASADGTARLWVDPTVPEWRRVYAKRRIDGLDFSPDGTRLATAAEDGVGQQWTVATGKAFGSAMTLGGATTSIRYSPDGKRLLMSSLDKTAQQWDAATGARIGPTMRQLAMIRDAAYSADGSLIATGGNDGVAQIWNAKTSTPNDIAVHHAAGVTRVTFSADGSRLVTSSDDYSVQIWDVLTGVRVGRPLTFGDPVVSVALSADGQRVLAGSNKGEGRLWDAATGAQIGGGVTMGRSIWAVAFTPDAQHALFASLDGSIDVYSTFSGQPADASSIARFADGLAGMRLTSGGAFLPLTPDAAASLRDETARRRRASPKWGSFDAFLARYFGDTATIRKEP